MRRLLARIALIVALLPVAALLAIQWTANGHTPGQILGGFVVGGLIGFTVRVVANVRHFRRHGPGE